MTRTLNNHNIKFSISNARCFYEGQGASIRNTETDQGLYYVIDIGGKNDTHIMLDNFKPVKDKNSMTNNGLLKSLQMVASDLSITGYEFTIKDVEDMLLGKRQRVPQLDEIFSEYATLIVKKIRNQIQKFDPNLYFTTFIFTGGGAVVLEKQIREEFKEEFNITFATDARYDNCKGALEKVVN